MGQFRIGNLDVIMTLAVGCAAFILADIIKFSAVHRRICRLAKRPGSEHLPIRSYLREDNAKRQDQLANE